MQQCAAPRTEERVGARAQERQRAAPPTKEGEQGGPQRGVQDLVVCGHVVALEQLVLEGGGEAIKAEVAQHEEHAEHASLPA